MTWILFIAVNAMLPVVGLGEGHAIEQGGNIFVVDSGGNRMQITSSRVDSQPDLAFDESKIVFVRNLGDRSEIWIADVKAGAEPRPLVKTPLEIQGRRFNHVFTPKFGPGDRVVYFMIPFAATTQAILKIDVGKPDPQFVAAALNFQIVTTGKYRGDLIAQIRKAKLAPGYYEWYWLLTPDGKEIGVVGQDEGDVAMFMELQGVLR